MTNDTSTLQGSLYECKDQLIYELGEQGVTATYDPTTGLLGLIHKISDIQPPSITLATNKSILSSYHSETATLTATHSYGAGKTVEIYNAVTGTKIGDATDNQDGTYTYTYNSAGIGDISMTAVSGALESNAITIEDCKWYDEAVTDHTHSTDYSNFGSAPTLTVDTDGMKVSTTSGERWATIPYLIGANDDYELSFKYQGMNLYYSIHELSTASNSRRMAIYQQPNGEIAVNPTGSNYSNIGVYSLSIGDTIIIKRVSGLMYMTINDTVVINGSYSNTYSGYIAFETYQDGRWGKYKDITLKIL